MTRYIKQHPYHIIRAIRSIGSIAMYATYFYVAQFLALVITLSAIGGTNGALFGQQIDISVLKSVNVIFLLFVACMIVAYILTLIWNRMGGRRPVAFPTGPVLGIGLVHLLRHAGVYTIYSTGKAAAATALGLILIYFISRAAASYAENKALAHLEHKSVELSGDTFTIYAYPDSRDFMVTRSVEAVSEPAEETPAPVLDQDGVEEEIQDETSEQVPAAPSVEELHDAYARVIREKQDKPAKHLGAAAKRKNLEPTGRKLTAHERKLQSRIRSGRRHK